MKVEILKEEDQFMKIKFEGISPRLMNIIRRYSINKVPVLAIDKIIVYENTSSFFDEYIAHRIGLIPLTSPENVDPEKIGIYLDAVGPRMVYSQDIKTTDDRVKVAVENIPVVRLVENQSLRIEGRVKRGIGREHAKFQSAIASYNEVGEGKYEFFIEGLYHRPVKETLKMAIKRVIQDLESIEKQI